MYAARATYPIILNMTSLVAFSEVVARSKAYVRGQSFTRIADSNPARGVDVCLL
jgi:hypothetical protein